MTRSIVSYRLTAFLERPGIRTEDISHQKTFLIPILVIDIDSIRQKQILSHPSFELAGFTLDIDPALKDAILLQDSTIKQHHP